MGRVSSALGTRRAGRVRLLRRHGFLEDRAVGLDGYSRGPDSRSGDDPILIGVKNTRRLLLTLLAFLGVLLLGACAVGWLPPVASLLVLNTLVFGGLFVVYKRRHLVDRLAFEGILDGNFILCGPHCGVLSDNLTLRKFFC